MIYKRVNHVLHALLTVMTFGLWLPIWIAVAVSVGSHNRAVDRRIGLATLVAMSTVVDDDGMPVDVFIDANGELHVVDSSLD